MVKDLTEENMVVKEEDVENLVYNPISYLQYNIEMDITSPLKIRRRKKISHTKSKRPTSMVDLTASDITVHSDHRYRSKTLIERVEDVGDKLKNAVHRTSSLDILHVKNRRNNTKDVSLKPESSYSSSTVTVNDNKEQLTFASSGRSLSCSDFPDLPSTVRKAVVKTLSFDQFNKKNEGKDLYSQTMSRPSTQKLQKPIITVDLAESNEYLDTNSNYLKHRLSSNCTASMGSLHSFRSDYGTDSDTEKYSSDSSSVFNSENGHSDNFLEATIDNDKCIEDQFFHTSNNENRRPKSALGCSIVENVDLDLAFKATSTPLQSAKSSPYLNDLDLTRERSKSHCVSSKNEQKLKENISGKSNSEKDLIHVNRSSGSVPWFLQSPEKTGLNRISKKWQPKSMMDIRKMRSSSDDLPDLKSLERAEHYQSVTELPNENLKNFIAKSSKDHSLFHKIFKRRARSLPTKKNAPIFFTPNLSLKKRVMVESIV